MYYMSVDAFSTLFGGPFASHKRDLMHCELMRCSAKSFDFR